MSQFCYIIFCLHILFFGYIAVAHHPIYGFLTRSEGAVEFLTFVAFLLGGVALFAAALTTRRLLTRCAYVFGGIVLLFFAGEEISWGQRIIGFATPDFLADLNFQGEFNIHNIRAVDEVVGFSAQRAMILMLCLAGCAAFFARKNRIFGIPSPPILLTLTLLLTMSYFRIGYGGAIFNFESLTLFGYGWLFLLLLMAALLAMNARLFIATAAALSIALCTDYVFHHYLSHHAFNLAFREPGEYLFSICCLFYALTALLDQRTARQKIAASVAAIKSATALPSIRIKSPPPITEHNFFTGIKEARNALDSHLRAHYCGQRRVGAHDALAL